MLRRAYPVGERALGAPSPFLTRYGVGSEYEPPKILKEKVKKGELGKKTGKGFYTWSD